MLVIDEYPYLRDAVKGMDSILQALLDSYRDRSKLSLVVCGSYAVVMRSLLVKESPLYGRIDLKVNLRPMDYLDSARFYPGFSSEDKVRQYLVRANRAGRIDPPLDLIGRYRYDDPADRMGGGFDVVTHDPNGYALYKARFRGMPVTEGMVAEGKAQVGHCGLDCYKFGFFSRSGFTAKADGETVLIGLVDMYRDL